MISGLSFTRHSHRVVLHVQLSIHGGMVLSWWLPCWLPALMSVRCLVYTFDFSRLVTWWVVVFLRHLKFYCCIEWVSMATYLCHSFCIMCSWGWCMCGQKIFFLWLPMRYDHQCWSQVLIGEAWHHHITLSNHPLQHWTHMEGCKYGKCASKPNLWWCFDQWNVIRYSSKHTSIGIHKGSNIGKSRIYCYNVYGVYGV